jgi:hypothetical protein
MEEQAANENEDIYVACIPKQNTIGRGGGWRGNKNCKVYNVLETTGHIFFH